MRHRFRRIFETCHPYVVKVRYGAAAEADEDPFGLRIASDLHFDPHVVRSGAFLTTLGRLDELTFGPVGMTMPRWVFYDCAEVPGGIFGFARPVREVAEWVRRALRVDPAYDGMVPLSMFVAIPMLEVGSWLTYTLSSLNEVAPGSAPAGLRLLTEAAGLRMFRVRTAYGTTQWRSTKLSVHARFGPLDLVTAWTPAHSDPWTLTYRFPATDERIHRALEAGAPKLGSPDAVARWVDCDDENELRGLQREVEAGRRIQVIGPPVVDGSFVRVPLQEVDEP